MASQFPDLDESVQEIPAAELKRRLDDGEQITLLDTRRPADFEQWHITHPNLRTVNIPFTEFLDEHGTNPASEVPEGVPTEPLVTCCAKGISSLYVAEFLAREGWAVTGLADGMEGWARLNEAHPLDLGEQVAVVQFHRPSSGCLAYLLVAADEAAVVDPLRSFADDYRKAARDRGATLRYAIDTHVHADHVSGVRTLAERTDATPVMPAGADERGLAVDAELIADGDELPLGDRSIEAVGLPGHTTEMTGYRFGGALSTGDALFLDSVARPDLEDEDRARTAAGTLWETIQDLGSLSGDIVVAPGHVGPATAPADDGTFTARIGDLRERLVAFEAEKEAFVERVLDDLPPRPSNFERIIAVNLGRESASVEEAFELELGPNNCAVDV
jgi:glyoxylase-like metal-dependent hydrolase (beta-lactamase superfamily II)/rhodanese-related sulfurtransferase